MSHSEVRTPAVAGMFYEDRREALVRQIEACYRDPRGPGAVPDINDAGPREIIGLVCPHAGYMYSGPTAAKAMARLAADGRPEVFIIIGPNHGRGSYVSAIQTAGHWRTPLGDSPVDEGVAGAIALACPNLRPGAEGFLGEHSLEVELPFLQHLYGVDIRIVPIMMLDQGLRAARALGQAVAQAIDGMNAVMIASTDMTHFESAEVARRQDRILIERMEALDPEGMLRERERRGITMCGYGPVAAMLFAALELGANRARMIDYTDSGAVGSRAEVVAYLALEVLRER